MPERAPRSTVENTPHGPIRRDPPCRTPPARAPLPRLHRLLALATDNRPVRGCLAVFASSAPIAFAFSGSVYATIPLLLTEPLSLLGVVLPVGPGSVEGSGPAAVLAAGVLGVRVLLCALVNAAVIGALAHHLRATRHACPTAVFPPTRRSRRHGAGAR